VDAWWAGMYVPSRLLTISTICLYTRHWSTSKLVLDGGNTSSNYSDFPLATSRNNVVNEGDCVSVSVSVVYTAVVVL
jgi:hypothetical protein